MEVTARLRERRLESDSDFEWLKVLRFYLEVSFVCFLFVCCGTTVLALVGGRVTLMQSAVSFPLEPG